MLAILGLLISNWRLVFIGAAVGAGLGWLAYEHHKIYAEGEAAAIQKVEKDNAASEGTADKAQAEVQACYARGARFSWDRTRSVCVGS